MADYTKMKNADLEALLKERSLPHTGKKADMVARLQEDDKKKPGTNASEAPAASSTTAAAPPAEDEIDWDDDAIKPDAATTEASTAAMAAGGQGRVANPTAVPNQIEDPIDTTNTADLTVKSPSDQKPAVKDATNEPTKLAEAETEAKPAADFSQGLTQTTLEEELEKRKARAKKFGIPETDEEALKKMERAKKFGETAGPKGLNEALPERAERKRGRDRNDEGGRGDSKRGGRRSEARRGGERRSERRSERTERAEKKAAPRSNGGGSSWMNEKDKEAAERRKARFATAGAS